MILVSFASLAQNKLEYRLAVGDTFTVYQEAKQLITQDINGVDQIIQNDLKGSMHFEVLSATPENYTLSMSFKRLKMLMTSPSLGELSNADTDSADSTDITNMLFKGILNIPVSIVMERTGKIKSVTGGDKLIANIIMTLSGTQTTSVIINPTNGLFKEITTTGENSGDTMIQAQNMTIPTHISSTITYKISQ